MQHKDALKALFPLDLEGVQDEDIVIEGNALDDVQTSAETLLGEIFPDTADELLLDWERNVENMAGEGPVALRRDRLVAALRATGGLSRPYFESMGDAFGYEIKITACKPFVCGESVCGDELCDPGARYLWRVEVTNAFIQDAFFETLFKKLKPAWTDIEFSYTG